MNIEKIMSILLWVVVAAVIVVFVSVLVVGYSTNYNFIFSLEDVSGLTNTIANKGSLLG